MEMQYASKGVGTAGLTTGIIGTALGTVGSGLLGNITGGGMNNTQLDLIYANRDLALAKSELAMEKKIVETYSELGKQINALEKTVSDNAAAQAVINCGFQSNIGILQTQVAQLMGMTKLGIPQANIIPTASGTGG